MIMVNNRPEPYFVGMTLQNLLEKMNYTYPVLTIRINGELVEDKEQEREIQKGDKVEVIHPILGG